MEMTGIPLHLQDSHARKSSSFQTPPSHEKTLALLLQRGLVMSSSLMTQDAFAGDWMAQGALQQRRADSSSGITFVLL